MSSEFVARNHLHAGYSHPVAREIQSIGNEILPQNLMWPIFLVVPGLPDLSWHYIPKRENIFQITTKYTK
jgi:hypothetical protein